LQGCFLGGLSRHHEPVIPQAVRTSRTDSIRTTINEKRQCPRIVADSSMNIGTGMALPLPGGSWHAEKNVLRPKPPLLLTLPAVLPPRPSKLSSPFKTTMTENLKDFVARYVDGLPEPLRHRISHEWCRSFNVWRYGR
jgi:hypothetical protein